MCRMSCGRTSGSFPALQRLAKLRLTLRGSIGFAGRGRHHQAGVVPELSGQVAVEELPLTWGFERDGNRFDAGSRRR
ncbi:MAG: hypothetical protein ACT4PP_00480 [Sporichthyaceae bacterium]